jgi:hypothetical protein
MFSDKIKLLPINEIVPFIVNPKDNILLYFYDEMFLDNKLIYHLVKEVGTKLLIRKISYQSKINIYDYSLYKKVTGTSDNKKICCSCNLCISHQAPHWYEIVKQIIIGKNTIYLPISLKCLCDKCYNLFPYTKFLELRDKIMLLKELHDFINNDIMKYTMYFLIMS